MLLPYVYSLITMADVIAIFVADVVTTFYLCYYIWLVLLPYMCGRCYCHWGWCYCLPYLYFMADAIAKKVADVIAT